MDSSKQLSSGLKLILGIISLVSASALVSSGFLWMKLDKAPATTSTVSVEEEIKQIVSEVSEVLSLPQNEDPTLLTLTEQDIQAAQGQAFFANALVGDKLLFYQNNSKAILWRPTAKKVIEASIINTSQATSPAAGTPPAEGTTQ